MTRAASAHNRRALHTVSAFGRKRASGGLSETAYCVADVWLSAVSAGSWIYGDAGPGDDFPPLGDFGGDEAPELFRRGGHGLRAEFYEAGADGGVGGGGYYCGVELVDDG